MLVRIEPERGYFDFSVDVETKEYNNPRNMRSWDWDGPHEEDKQRRVRINGSEYLEDYELGVVILWLVAYARQFGCAALEYVDLGKREKK